MTAGILLSAANHRFHKDKLSMYYEFIPQLLFLSAMFGYLSLLIVMKWCGGSREAPVKADLYHIMIYMFLSPGMRPSYHSPRQLMCMPRLHAPRYSTQHAAPSAASSEVMG
jgi:vacuolar-type H+-ATPase subunit I/STV1